MPHTPKPAPVPASRRRVVLAGGRAAGLDRVTDLPAGTEIVALGSRYRITDTWTVHGYLAECVDPTL